LKKPKMVRFFLLREKIKEEIKSCGNWASERIGKRREFMVNKILKELKTSGIISGFVPSGRFSYSDIKEGIDFYVVRIDKRKYQSIPLSITGKAWVENHKKRHPDIPTVEIEFYESYETMKNRIVEAINAYQ